MKVTIIFDLKEGPYGGANQFLKALKKYFKSINVYEESYGNADVVLFNSYQNVSEAAKLKYQYPNKVFIHRVIGPIRLYNTGQDKRDDIANIANRLIADGTIFQSQWSREQNHKVGFNKNNFDTVITNAADPNIFSSAGKGSFHNDRKIRVIANSWSSNWKKGFMVYQWLDNNLDFNKIEMAFIGNAPIVFKNIGHIQPLNSEDLAKELKRNDIFITASEKEACSNSLIEALSCGLPAIAVRDGSHPEVIGKGGEVFNNPQDIPFFIEKMANNYEFYQKSIKIPALKETGDRYYNFCNRVYETSQTGEYTPKKLSSLGRLRIIKAIYAWKIDDRKMRIMKKLANTCKCLNIK